MSIMAAHDLLSWSQRTRTMSESFLSPATWTARSPRRLCRPRRRGWTQFHTQLSILGFRASGAVRPSPYRSHYVGTTKWPEIVSRHAGPLPGELEILDLERHKALCPPLFPYSRKRCPWSRRPPHHRTSTQVGPAGTGETSGACFPLPLSPAWQKDQLAEFHCHTDASVFLLEPVSHVADFGHWHECLVHVATNVEHFLFTTSMISPLAIAYNTPASCSLVSHKGHFLIRNMLTRTWVDGKFQELVIVNWAELDLLLRVRVDVIDFPPPLLNVSCWWVRLLPSPSRFFPSLLEVCFASQTWNAAISTEYRDCQAVGQVNYYHHPQLLLTFDTPAQTSAHAGICPVLTSLLLIRSHCMQALIFLPRCDHYLSHRTLWRHVEVLQRRPRWSWR